MSKSKPSRPFRDIFASRKTNAEESSTQPESKLLAIQSIPGETNTTSTISDSSATTLVGPYPGTAQVHFSSLEHLFQEYDRFAQAGYSGFLVHNVVPEICEEIIERKEERHPLRIKLYLPESMELFITIPGQPHEDLHLEISGEIIDAYRRLGNWKQTGSTTFAPSSELRAQVGAGEGDSGGKPKDLRPATTDWPTIVVEAGYSHSLANLCRKMQWWFSASNHRVKIVILASFENPHGRAGPNDKIIVQKWIETFQDVPRPDRVTRSRRSVLKPSLDHSNTITFHGPPITAANWYAVDLNHFVVTRGDMILEYRHLFLREAQTQRQRSIVLTENFWKRYGCEVWKSVRSFRDGIRPQPSY